MSELRTRMIRDMTLRGFSPRTHASYIAAVVHSYPLKYPRGSAGLLRGAEGCEEILALVHGGADRTYHWPGADGFQPQLTPGTTL